jgi:hypothetical protein
MLTLVMLCSAAGKKHKDSLSTSNNMATKAAIRRVALELNREIQEHADISPACHVSWTIFYTDDSIQYRLNKEDFDRNIHNKTGRGVFDGFV